MKDSADGGVLCHRSAPDLQIEPLVNLERDAEVAMLLLFVAKGSARQPQNRPRQAVATAKSNFGPIPPPTRFPRKQRNEQLKERREICGSIR